MRPLCGKKHGGNRKSQGALARLCEFPGRFRIYRAQRSQQGCSLSLGMLRLAEPPTGRARLRSSLKSPRNPITPFETSRVSTLHPELYKNLREGARRVIGATAKPLYPIDGKAEGLDRRNPQTSLLEGGGPSADGGRSFRRWKELRKAPSKLHMLHMHHMPDTHQAYDVFFSFFELLRPFFANETPQKNNVPRYPAQPFSVK